MRFSTLLFVVAAYAGVMDPFNKTSRIAVIGAGPSGVHMASRLQKLGFKNITLLERTHRVGGKSYTLYRNSSGVCEQQKDEATGNVDTEHCIAHEMGTCFLHNGYHTVRALVDEYGLTPEIAPEGRAMFSRFAKDQWSSQELSDFIISDISQSVKDGAINIPDWISEFSETLVPIYALVTGINAYNILHESIFGDVEFSMPDRISPAKLKLLNMTFAEFLDENGLQAVSGFLTFAHAAQGYGYVSSIPAFYGLVWITPELLNGYLQMSMHQQLEAMVLQNKDTNNPLVNAFISTITNILVNGDAESVYRTTTMLPEGYAKIWKTMVETDHLTVQYGVEIAPDGIDRQLSDPSAPVIITYSADGVNYEEKYDFVIYTAAFAHSHKYVADLTTQETKIFKALTSYVLATTILNGDAVANYTKGDHGSPIMYNVAKMVNRSMDGEWYADRNDPFILGNDHRQVAQTRVAYQFYEDGCAADPVLCDTDRSPIDNPSNPNNPKFTRAENVLDKLMSEFEEQRATGITVIEQFPWPYFHHFEQPSIQSGFPWDIVDMQGTSKTWWLGASASFESVHDVTNYNLMILKKYISDEDVAATSTATATATSTVLMSTLVAHLAFKALQLLYRQY